MSAHVDSSLQTPTSKDERKLFQKRRIFGHPLDNGNGCADVRLYGRRYPTRWRKICKCSLRSIRILLNVDHSLQRCGIRVAANSTNTRTGTGSWPDIWEQLDCAWLTSRTPLILFFISSSLFSVWCHGENHMCDKPVNSEMNLMARFSIAAAMITESLGTFENVHQSCIHPWQWAQFWKTLVMLVSLTL